MHSVYAGRSSGNEVTLAVSINGGKAAAYVCNGRTIQAWLQGSVTGNRIALAGRNGASPERLHLRPGHVRHGHGGR